MRLIRHATGFRTVLPLLLCAALLSLAGPVLPSNVDRPQFTLDHVILPLKFLSAEDPMPVVTVNDGKNKVEFFLDTGSDANLTLIGADIKKLNAKPTGDVQNSMTNYGKYRAQKYVIERLSLSGFKLKDVACEELPVDRAKNERYTSRSTMGLGLLRQYALLIDYANHKLTLYSPENYQRYIDVSHWAKVDSPYDPLGIVVNGSLEGHSYRFCIDTGCVAFDNASKRSYNMLKGAHKQAFNKPLTKVDGIDVIDSISLKLGAQTLTGLNFMFPDFLTQPETIDGFLGGDFLEKYAVLVDFKHNCLFLRKTLSE